MPPDAANVCSSRWIGSQRLAVKASFLARNGPRAASGRIKNFAIANSIMDIIAQQGNFPQETV
jgi:hypothetical protein